MAIGRVGVRPYGGSTTTTTTALSYDGDAQAFITAAALTDTGQKTAVNDLVLDLKAAGIWTKMKAIYPMVGGTTTTHKWNLKDPRDVDAAFRLGFNMGWTHSSTGALPDGVTGYANTYCSTSNMGLNSAHLSFYSRTNSVTATARVDIGVLKSSPNSYSDISTGSANLSYFRFNNSDPYDSIASTNSLGFFIGSRTAAGTIKTYKNGNILISGVAGSNTTTTYPFFIGAVNNVGTGSLNSPAYYSNKQCAFASIGDGLTDLESNVFYQIVEKFQYALGRNINTTKSFYFNRNYSNETNTFIFNGSISDATQQSAISTLVGDLKAAGLWAKLKAVYPMVGGTALAHQFNLINPLDDNANAFKLQFNGGWSHNSLGAKPNGVDGYARTFLTTPETQFSLASHHISYYNVTNSSGGTYHAVTNPSGTGKTEIANASTNNWANIAVGSAVNKAYGGLLGGTSGLSTELGSSADPRGFVALSRTSSTLLKSYRNGVLGATNTTAASRLPYTWDYNIGCNYFSDGNQQRNSWSDRQAAFISFGSGLTDLESQIFYQIVEKFQYTLGRNVSAAQPFYYNSSYSNETNAFIFNGAISTTTQISALDTLVKDLKSSGIWTKMKAVYPMIGGTAFSHKFNLVNPGDTDSAFRLAFSGGWTHTETGALPNGSNAYADTFLIPSSTLLQNSTHISYYSRTNSSSSVDFGTSNLYANLGISGGIYYRVNQNLTESSISNSDSRGFYQINRISSITESVYKNSIKSDSSRISTTPSNAKIFLGGVFAGNWYYSNRETAFSSIGDGLTNLESNLFYQIVEKYQYALGRNINATQPFYYNSAYSNETNAFIFNGAISDATQQSAINTLVSDLKAAGIWTKMKAVYPMVGGTALSHKFNLVNPVDTDAAYRLVFNGGWTHSATGALPNGSNAFANTALTPRSNLTSMNNHLSYYSRTNNTTGTVYDNGCSDQLSGILGQSFIATFNHRINTPKAFIQCLDANAASGTETNSLGLIMASRTSSTSLKLYRNSILKGTNTTSTSILLPNILMTLGALNNRTDYGMLETYYGNKECAFASIGDGLTDAEALTFYNAVQAFQTTLNRQV
jgi:hypothetical protein